MKILMLARENILFPDGGLGVHCQHLARELVSLGNDVTVLCSDGKTQVGCAVESDGYRVVFVENINSLNMKNGVLSNIVTQNNYMVSALSYLGRESFDLIHLHDSDLWNVAEQLSALYRIPVVMTSHLSMFLSHPRMVGYEPWEYGRNIELAALNRCNRVITVSETYKRGLERDMLIDSDKISVIYNGVDGDFLSSVEADVEPEIIERAKGRPIVTFVGRMVPTKGVSALMQCAKKMKDYYFCFVTNVSPSVEDILPLVVEMKEMKQSVDNVSWLNFYPQDKKWGLMKGSDFGIVPSYHEPFGIVGLEWLGLGVPLIISDVGGLGEFCGDGNADMLHFDRDLMATGVLESGYSSELDKISALEIEMIIRACVLNENKIKNGLKTVENFSWSLCARKTLNVYEEVCDAYA